MGVAPATDQLRAVWKFVIPTPMESYPNVVDCKVRLPDNYRVVHHGLDPQGAFCIWMEVDPIGGSNQIVTFRWFGTGHPVPRFAQYVASLQEGQFVWHLYEFQGSESYFKEPQS